MTSFSPMIGAIQAGLIGNHNIPKPRYIVEFPGCLIHDVDNSPKVAQELDTLGFGIISYTWGRFQNKLTYEASLNAPKFDNLNKPGPNQIWWYIPKLKPGYFTVDEVRGVLENVVKTKYVWWDWACIPQYWDSTDPKTGQPTVDQQRAPQLVGYLPDRHKQIATQEVAKQFYIYTLAKKGVIWMHDIEWVATSSPRRTAIQMALEKAQRPNPVQDLNAAVGEIKTAVEHFQRMKQEDAWLSSMWTFQEGILLNTDNVVDPRDDTVLGTRTASQFARLVDKKGNVFKADTCFRGEGTILDITGRATILTCDIARLITEAIKTNQVRVASDLQTWLLRLYETGLVSVAADSPLDVLEAAKARGVTSMSELDYSVNAILGALRIVLPDDTPAGLNATDLTTRRTALLNALVARHGWRMLLLSKPTRGTWNPSFPSDPTVGEGDWVSSLLTRTWQFTSLGVLITSQIGRTTPPKGPYLIPLASLPFPTRFNRPGLDTASLTQPVPYTDNVLLLGAMQARDHIALPQLRHASAVHSSLGLPGDAPDAMVVGPEDEDARLFGSPPPYGVFCYGVGAVTKQGKNGQPEVVNVPQSVGWTSCRFYASRAEAAPVNPGNTNIFPVKTGTCFVKSVDFGSAFRQDVFGAGVGVVLLPVEDVSVYKGSVKEGKNGIERVVVVRCVVLTEFRTGPLQNGSGVTVGGGIFLGIGDFTFQGSPQAVPIESVLGEGWMTYMY